MKHLIPILILSLFCSLPGWSAALDREESDFDADAFEFEDKRLKRELHLPEWFKLSFLDLQDDLDAAVREGKDGIISLAEI